MLTPEEIEQFHREGYLIVRNAIDADTLARLQDETDAWIERATDSAESNARFVFKSGNGPRRLERINHPIAISPLYWDLATSDMLLDRVERLLGSDISFHHSKINLKQPGGGAEIGWHQDYPFFPHTNYDLLACGIALDAATVENGCLMVVPGSHTGPLLSHRNTDGEFVGSIPDTSVGGSWNDEAVLVEMQPGDMSIHHCRTIHGSTANMSAAGRRLLIMQFNATDALPFEPKPRINDYNETVVRGQPRTHARMADSISIELRGTPERRSSIFAVQR
jgi:ectoine hydroxylase-related dioxygenase (phytanoyl-CoA dioxygenase family)